jgi:NOL1/NOP2/fmu family ribosome biogenesis protein
MEKKNEYGWMNELILNIAGMFFFTSWKQENVNILKKKGRWWMSGECVEIKTESVKEWILHTSVFIWLLKITNW